MAAPTGMPNVDEIGRWNPYGPFGRYSGPHAFSGIMDGDGAWRNFPKYEQGWWQREQERDLRREEARRKALNGEQGAWGNFWDKLGGSNNIYAQLAGQLFGNNIWDTTGSGRVGGMPGIDATLGGGYTAGYGPGSGGNRLDPSAPNAPGWNPGPSMSLLGGGSMDLSTLIPGYQDTAPYDWNALAGQLFGQQGGGGGGGGGGNRSLLDPTMMQNIWDLQGQGLGGYQDFQNQLGGLGAMYNQQIGGTGQDLLNYLMGSMGGGDGKPRGGGGASYGYGGGGGGGNFPQSSIADLLAQLPEFQARDIRTDLPDLDPALAAELDVIRQSQLADFERLRGETNDDLLTQMFGRGVQRSTVAGEAANRANESMERTRLAILSEDMQRRLGIRKEEADRILAGDLASLGAEAGAYGDRMRSLTGIRGAEIGAGAQVQSANIGAGASRYASQLGLQGQLEGDRLRALASIYGSQSSGLASLFGNQVQGMSSGYGTSQDTISNFANLFGDLALGQGNLAMQQRQLGSSNAARNFQQQMDFLRFQEDVASRFQQGGLGMYGIMTERDIANLQAQTQLQLGKLGTPSTMDRVISASGPIIAAALSGNYGNQNQGGGA